MNYTLAITTNSRPYCLERLLRSLRHLPKPNNIIIGNSTARDAPDWVFDWYEKIAAIFGYDDMRLHENRSPSAARRDLVSQCVTEFIMFLDDDVILTETSRKILSTCEDGCSDLVGGVWLQDTFSNYNDLMTFDQAREVELIDPKVPSVSKILAGFSYNLSRSDLESRYVVKTPITCPTTLEAVIFVDDLVPNIVTRTEIFKNTNFDDRFLYFFEWYDFYMSVRSAGLKCAVDTSAKFIHAPEKYACVSAAQIHPREDDRERFYQKWNIRPLFSGE